MKAAATIAALALAVIGTTWVVQVGVDKQARVDCLEWQNQAEQYPKFFLTHWQKEQCDDVGVTINAPVHGNQ